MTIIISTDLSTYSYLIGQHSYVPVELLLGRSPIMTNQETIDPLRRQHLDLREEHIVTPEGRTRVFINDGESPLIWLARRKGRDGKALIAPHQLLAGERLRLDFTRAHLMPRTTTN